MSQCVAESGEPILWSKSLYIVSHVYTCLHSKSLCIVSHIYTCICIELCFYWE